MKKGIIITTALFAIALSSCKKKGCTDPLATNYQSEAKKDDGSCIVSETLLSYEITEDITIPTVFENKTYTICADIDITSELTIMPGAVIIMCAGAAIEVKSTGFLKAEGTANLPIVFKGLTETKGYWQGIAIKSTNPNNSFSYVTVKDAGTYWAWENSNIFLTGSLALNHSTISNSNDIGLYVGSNGSLSSFNSNIFSNNTTGLNLKVSQVKSLDGASDYNLNNTNDYIYVRGGSITTDATWQKLNTPLLVYEFDCEAGLTLSPGVNIKMEAGSYGIRVLSSGYLNCEGTATNPIHITGKYSSPGYWAGIKIISNNPNNKFNYVRVQDGGQYWAYEYANIYLNGGRLDLDNSIVSVANSYGLYAESNSQVFTFGIVQNTASGVLSNNSFLTNGTGANANCTGGCAVFFN